MKQKVIFLAIITLVLFSCKKSENNPKPDDGDQKQQWQFYTTANSKLPNSQVNTIAVSKNNTKWIGTANGLASISGNTWTIYKVENSGLPSSNILSLAVQANGHVWIGTDKGLAKFNGSNWSIYGGVIPALKNEAIMSVTCDDQHGRVWAGTSKGIIEIAPDDQITWHDETEDILPLSMAIDQTGALWIGAHEPFSFRGSVRKFQSGVWKSYQLDQMGYESAFPYAIAIDKNNDVVTALTGTATRAVIKFNGTAWIELTLPQSAKGMRALAVEQDRIWTGGVAFMRLSGSGNSIVPLPSTHNTILAIAVDTQGYKWLGTIDNGLVVYHE